MRSLGARLIFVAAAAIGCGAEPAPPPRAAPGAFGVQPLSLPADVVPTGYRLELVVDPELDRYSGSVEIELDQKRGHTSLWLHARNLTLLEAELRSATGWQHVMFRQVPSGMAEIVFPERLAAGKLALRIRFSAPFSNAERGVLRVQSGGSHYVTSFSEPTFARDSFPCLDEPHFRAPFEIALTVPEHLVAVSNAAAVSSTRVKGGNRRVVFAPTAPLPTYLAMFAVGPFDTLDGPALAPNDVRARPLQLRVLAPRGKAEALRSVLEDAAELLPDLERYTGFAFPLDKLDFVVIPEVDSAMENPGAIVLPAWWASVDARERPPAWSRGIRSTVAHELAHLWFGDLVTVDGWADLWTKEGLATWMATKLVDARHPEDGAGLLQLHDTHLAMMDDETGEALRPAERNDDRAPDAYGSITYDKAAAIVASFERWLDPEHFRAAMRDHLGRHFLGSATSKQLLASLARSAGRDIEASMRSFVDQAGVPLVQVRLECAPGQRVVVLRQQPWRSTDDAHASWRIPICVRYPSAGHTREACTLLVGPDDRLPLDVDDCPAWVHPNADGAGYYRWSLPPDELEALVKNRQAVSPRERLSIGANTRAAFRHRELSAAQAFAALEALASDPDPRIAVDASSLLSGARRWFTDEPHVLNAIERYLSSLYAPARGRTSWTSDALRTEPYRRALLAMLAHSARDPEVRGEARRRGRAYLGLEGDGRLHPEAVSWDLLELALSVAAEDGDASLVDAVLAHLAKTEDELLRHVLLRTLGSVRRPELAARVRELSLDGKLRRTEATVPLRALLNAAETRDATLRWVDEHTVELERKLGAKHVASFLASAGQACDSQHLLAVLSRIYRESGRLDARSRMLDAAANQIRRCLNDRAALADGVRGFLAARK